VPAQFNHTIAHSRDPAASAAFLAELLGLPAPTTFGPFQVVELSNGVSLDFMRADGPVHPQHYAFLVGEDDFDDILGRIGQQGLTYWADPFHREENAINHNEGGRGVYWEDPDGHNLEIITRPYGG
jgi:catechol 2,3-dioxygenase-like lactoylglutathione lyase family enzyme